MMGSLRSSGYWYIPFLTPAQRDSFGEEDDPGQAARVKEPDWGVNVMMEGTGQGRDMTSCPTVLAQGL